MRIKIEGLREGSTDITFNSGEITGKDLHGYKVKNADDLKLSVRKSGNYLHISGSNTVVFETLCDRCAGTFETEQLINIEYVFHLGKIKATDDDIEIIDPSDNEGSIIFDDYYAEAFIIAKPFRDLCSENCKGICQSCGKDLNGGECGCSQETPIDPRWNKIKEILDKNNS